MQGTVLGTDKALETLEFVQSGCSINWQFVHLSLSLKSWAVLFPISFGPQDLWMHWMRKRKMTISCIKILTHHLEHLPNGIPSYWVTKKIHISKTIVVHYFNSHYKNQLLFLIFHQLREPHLSENMHLSKNTTLNRTPHQMLFKRHYIFKKTSLI